MRCGRSCRRLSCLTPTEFSGQVRAIIETFPSVRHIVASGDVKQALDGAHPMAHTLFQWIVTSNRTFIVRLPDSKRIERIPCRHQFLMKSATQEKEAKFQALKALHKKTVFAFHGSGMECWYVVPIARLCLYQHAGHFESPAQGVGYGPVFRDAYTQALHPPSRAEERVRHQDDDGRPSPRRRDLHCSAHVNLRRLLQEPCRGEARRRGGGGGGRGGGGGAGGLMFLEGSITCMAICEIIDATIGGKPTIKRSGGIWVIEDDDYINTVREGRGGLGQCACLSAGRAVRSIAV
eukprot:COSAG01_NODE_3110_length_6571_cov_218.696539_6_plen_292_part_00